ncbi:MAG: hypothetical protein HOC65_06845, partial [Actinobacteria bacterium]|nr:hypothetical protein [Actinomycetota bacterium]
RDFNTTLHPDDIVEWDAPLFLTDFDHMGKFWDWARDCGNGDSLFRVLPTYPGAVETLHRLADQHHIIIVTTKPDFAVNDTYAWLEQHNIPNTEVHIVDDKTTVNIDLLLDDADHNLQAVTTHRPDVQVCRYIRPWNSPTPGAHDIETWAEFETYVNALPIMPTV